ncbi:Leu/Phe/Val dehydrogenase [Sporohalobacter salinus]|uniref:Leu/Phe/Val dehydrogenase n=1 Tax=Sporohalobacter salinus TaxID=1494606 RepID=UPI00195F31A7|nr:amino acid dehydrogenase [Sporohalobacter salinus]MBM7624418.1 leucine dehydrogenase [Sporohalobacter salinus]
MDIFDEMKERGHEQIIFNYDEETDLKMIIAIHDTTLGPALGGCRMKNYESQEEALDDVMRLSKGMTYKCGVAEVDFGGAKAIIWGDPEEDKSKAMMRAVGRFVETLDNRFYTGTDVGTYSEDFIYSNCESDHIVGLPESYGGGGNSAIITAYGTYRAIKATAKEAFGDDSLEGLTISVQGLGKVGYRLLDHLHDEGAELIGTDVKEEYIERAKEEYPIEIVDPDEIFGVECDIFSPNALGAILDDETIPQLKCKAIAGAANNQLAEPRHGDKLHELDIVYAPDYIANAGGLMQVADEVIGYNEERVKQQATNIYDILLEIYEVSNKKNIPTYQAADEMVENDIETISRLKTNYVEK